MAEPAIRLVWRKIDELIPYEGNAKQHPQAQIDRLVNSFDEFGRIVPAGIDAAGNLIYGHGRILAARQRGDTEFPCIEIDGLSETQRRAFVHADNILAESPTDQEILRGEMEALAAAGFDIRLTGYADADLILDPSPEVEEDDYEVSLPDAPNAKRGQIYLLGRHRLMCGDATQRADVEALVGGASIDLFLTDPPYNVALGMDQSVEQAKKRHRRTDGLTMANDKMSGADFRKFLASAFSNAAGVMKGGAAFYIWHADSEGYNFRGACLDSDMPIRQCLIWVKDRFVLGRQDFQWMHEPCLYGEKPVDGTTTPEDDPEHNMVALYGWTDGGGHYFFKNRKQTTVLHFERPTASKQHPTMKPVKLFDYHMQCSTRPGENVLDLFAGSGTTIMAAEQNSRVAFCMEIDPRFVDVIIDRWEKFTGKKAVLLDG